MDLKTGHAPLIVSACRKQGLLRNQTAYVLATAKHETGNFKYMREIWGPTAAQKRYEGRKDLGNTVKGDGKRFMGRGFVQITGRRNYTDWSKRLGLDLLKEPQLAERPDVAVRILVEGMRLGTFTGKRLSDYITLTKSDFRNARRIVNGMDKADLIAGYANQYNDLLRAGGYGEGDSSTPPIDLSGLPKAPLAEKPTAPAQPVKAAKKPAAIAGVIALAAAAGAWLADLPCSWLGMWCQ